MYIPALPHGNCVFLHPFVCKILIVKTCMTNKSSASGVVLLFFLFLAHHTFMTCVCQMIFNAMRDAGDEEDSFHQLHKNKIYWCNCNIVGINN